MLDTSIAVLVVDDHQPMIDVVTPMLRRLGFQTVDHALDAITALTMMRAKPYGLIIADWKMDPIDGLQLLECARADQALKHIPFVMMTANSQTEFAIRAKLSGASAILVKPFSSARLARKLSEALA